MRRRAKFAVFLAFFSVTPACSLFVSVDDLSGGGASGAGSDASLDGNALNGDGATHQDSGSPDADSGLVVFVDDFDRTDAPLLGNGWIEKGPDAFSLSGNAVLRSAADGGGVDYPDKMVYRPSVEDVLDVETSVELVFSANVAGFPQLHSRIQKSTVATPGVVDSYLFYLENSTTTAVIARTHDVKALSDLVTVTISPPLAVGERYRLRFRVTGTIPVALDGIVEHQVAGNWVNIGESSTVDTDFSLIANPGSVGFSGSLADTDPYSYDNFTRTTL